MCTCCAPRTLRTANPNEIEMLSGPGIDRYHGVIDSAAGVCSDLGASPRRSSKMDMKLEVVVIPVADVERSKRFYTGLGWRLDADFIVGNDFRGVQFTPPGSPC